MSCMGLAVRSSIYMVCEVPPEADIDHLSSVQLNLIQPCSSSNSSLPPAVTSPSSIFSLVPVTSIMQFNAIILMFSVALAAPSAEKRSSDVWNLSGTCDNGICRIDTQYTDPADPLICGPGNGHYDAAVSW